MNNLELLNHLKSKSKTEVVVTLGVFENKECVPMWVIDEEIRAYNNHIRQQGEMVSKPTDKEIQDILVAYKRRDAFATGNSGTTLKRATEMVRELYE